MKKTFLYSLCLSTALWATSSLAAQEAVDFNAHEWVLAFEQEQGPINQQQDNIISIANLIATAQNKDEVVIKGRLVKYLRKHTFFFMDDAGTTVRVNLNNKKAGTWIREKQELILKGRVERKGKDIQVRAKSAQVS